MRTANDFTDRYLFLHKVDTSREVPVRVFWVMELTYDSGKPVQFIEVVLYRSRGMEPGMKSSFYIPQANEMSMVLNQNGQFSFSLPSTRTSSFDSAENYTKLFEDIFQAVRPLFADPGYAKKKDVRPFYLLRGLRTGSEPAGNHHFDLGPQQEVSSASAILDDIARNPRKTSKEKDAILAKLSSPHYEVARAIFRLDKNPSDQTKERVKRLFRDVRGPAPVTSRQRSASQKPRPKAYDPTPYDELLEDL